MWTVPSRLRDRLKLALAPDAGVAGASTSTRECRIASLLWDGRRRDAVPLSIASSPAVQLPSDREVAVDVAAPRGSHGIKQVSLRALHSYPSERLARCD